jgi:hypothetical protein
MNAGTVLAKNIIFWHWYPQLLIEGLSDKQLHWQPEHHDSSINFALWHAYRACDELVHGMALQKPSVHASQGWADRLPVAQTGFTPFGNGMTREQIGAVWLDAREIVEYARCVGVSIASGLEAMSDEDAAAEIALPFFTNVYPDVDRMSRIETIAFFAIGHTSEHLGEVQMLKGLMGLKGAPL